MSAESLASIPTSYATASIGTPQTPLQSKLEAIASAGWQGIELAFPDLLSFASRNLGKEVDSHDYDVLCNAGQEVRRLCEGLGLKIVMLQPFSNFEGWKPKSEERKDAFTRVKGWIRIMEAIGCNMLQVGSSDSLDIDTSRDAIVSDLRELAELLAPYNFRLAYENWCWSTHAPDWQDVWDIVKRVDRLNMGLCLDTFQSGGGEWADPTTDSGVIESLSRDELENRFQESLAELSATVPAEKIFILQISDAYQKRMPSRPDESGLSPRARWSSCLRPVPFAGGYLPVVEFTRAVLKTGFRGWFSMEVFDGGPEGTDSDWPDMPGYAKKAMNAHKQLLSESAA
ncbi:uncharacterized protein KY384_002370 [Bacidia gigantensis]|uniref:uncharacterized protein n=1 Tax=Bacidia gigantensis TaxID=2732470 RepID=UPI001D057793|nr:uncharacterized protein KY384_002370 [Bacidia gigantensis]KAG8532493.1 hypothetical protein KY384_002370 [Bacidia gigantensis]